MIDFTLDKNAFALRPVRLLNEDELRYYEGTTFPKDPWGGCNLYLRRCNIFGFLTKEEPPFLIDIFDEEGYIIQDVGITKEGFEYLRRVFKFKVDKTSSINIVSEL